MGSNVKVLVYGWYGHGNLGDEAFKDSFRQLWSDFTFDFQNKIPRDLTPYQAIMIGGGSFLDQAIPGMDRVLDSKIPIAFIGVGIEGKINPLNLEVLTHARIVVTRNDFPTATRAQDLVFAQKFEPSPDTESKSILFLANNYFIRSRGPDWQVLGSQWFVQEMAQALDGLLGTSQYSNVIFYPMCVDFKSEDRIACAMMIDKMESQNRIKWMVPEKPQVDELLGLIGKSKLVISMRLHGAIFSTLLHKPFILVSGHDKMELFAKSVNWKGIVPFYGFTKKTFNQVHDELGSVDCLKTYTEESRKQWVSIAATVREKLFGSES